MRFKAVPFVALLFVVHFSRPGSFPAPRVGGAPVAGVVLRSYEQSKGTWVAHIENVSRKNVVFVNITVNENAEAGSYYAAAGSERYYYSSSGKLMLGSNAFPPNTTKDLNLGADANESITPVIDMVVYDDDTAEVANERAFQHYVLPFKETILTLQKENEILRQFASSPNRIADTVTELLRVASDLPDPHVRHDEDPHVNSEELLRFARDLKQGRINPETGMNEKIDPETVFEYNAKQIEIESKHTQITRITGDQI